MQVSAEHQRLHLAHFAWCALIAVRMAHNTKTSDQDEHNFIVKWLGFTPHCGGKDKEDKPVVITEQDLAEVMGHAMSMGEKLHHNLEAAIRERAGEDNVEF